MWNTAISKSNALQNAACVHDITDVSNIANVDVNVDLYSTHT